MMGKRAKGVICTAIALAAIVGAAVASGQTADGQPSAVFTPAQAAAGKTIFTSSCASCHLANLTGNDDAPALAGAAFRDVWKTRSTKQLLDYMSGAMPPGGSTLKADDYAEIVAYILERNGATAGEQPLTPATAVPIGSVIR